MTQDERDRYDYDGYVMGRLDAFYDHAGGAAAIWRDDVRRGRTAHDAFRGPWHIVRPHVTTEFRQWVEEHYAERLTFAEWRAARRAERAAERDAEPDAREYALGMLAYWRELNDRRAALVVDAREHGATWADIAAASGMSRQALDTMAKSARPAAAATVPAYDPDEPF